MRLTQKLILYALAVALVPLAATGFTLIRIGEQALRERILEHQQTAAVALAEKVDLAVEELARRLSGVTELVDVGTLSAEEQTGLLRLVFRQSAEIASVSLLDPRGRALGPAVFLTHDAAVGVDLAGHPRSDAEGLRRALEALPAPDSLTAAHPGEVLMSPAYYPVPGPAHMVVAVPCSFTRQGRAQGVLAVDVALRDGLLRLDGIDVGHNARVLVVDAAGRAILHPSAAPGEALADDGAVRAAISQVGGPDARRFVDASGAMAAAFAPVGDLGWRVVVEQPERDAFAAALQMRQRTLAWICGTTAMVLASSLWFAGNLRRSLARLVQGARAFGAGRLEERIAVVGGDEIAELGTTLNAMAGELQVSLRDLKAWSHTLEDRVSERTQALQRAQAQLLLQAELAAIGQLGAGVAHEVNNPLAALLGHVQLLLLRRAPGDPDYASLKEVEAAAQRCRSITLNLLRFSQLGDMGRQPMDVNAVVQDVVGLMEGSLRQAALEVRSSLEGDLPPVLADAGQISVVLTNLVSNARNATPQHGRIDISTTRAHQGVIIAVTDTGRGIAPEHLPRIFEPFFTTKQVWTGVGLGLSVAYRIVSDHGGRIEAHSDGEHGSTFTVFLPSSP